VEYDGAISQKKSGQTGFAVLAATKKSAEQMEQFLEKEHRGNEKIADALELAFDTWTAGQKIGEEQTVSPTREELRSQRSRHAVDGAIEAVVLERRARSAQQFRALAENELASLPKIS
jgi:arginyl-tRNA synthetase